MSTELTISDWRALMDRIAALEAQMVEKDRQIRVLAEEKAAEERDHEVWTDKAFGEVEVELGGAMGMHPPLNSPHEGYAVILKELDKLWLEVRMTDQSTVAMRKEACQVAAMAIRFMVDLT